MNRMQLERKKQADEYMPGVRSVLGVFFFREATVVEDREENTDLRIIQARDLRIAVRVRTPDTLRRAQIEAPSWLQEITFRSGGEIQKMFRKDLGTHFFYGFGNEDGRSLHSWILVDLDLLRRCAAIDQIMGRKYNVTHVDMDDGTAFEALDMLSVDPSCIVAASENHPCRAMSLQSNGVPSSTLREAVSSKSSTKTKGESIKSESVPVTSTPPHSGYGFDGFTDYEDLCWDTNDGEPVPQGEYVFMVEHVNCKDTLDYTIKLCIQSASNSTHDSFVGRSVFETLNFSNPKRMAFVRRFAEAAEIAVPKSTADLPEWTASLQGVVVAGRVVHKAKAYGDGFFVNVIFKKPSTTTPSTSSRAS